jgi:hypothetical protein
MFRAGFVFIIRRHLYIYIYIERERERERRRESTWYMSCVCVDWLLAGSEWIYVIYLRAYRRTAYCSDSKECLCTIRVSLICQIRKFVFCLIFSMFHALIICLQNILNIPTNALGAMSIILLRSGRYVSASLVAIFRLV